MPGDGLLLHSLTSPEYVRQVVKPGLEAGAGKAGRDPASLILGGGGFIITGPNQASLSAKKAEVRRRIAFYSSTRTYFPILEIHGFEEVGQQLHQLSVEGRWAEMPELVDDQMLDAFTVVGEYDEIAPKFIQRYGGLLNEINFSMDTSSSDDESQLRRIIRQFQEQP